MTKAVSGNKCSNRKAQLIRWLSEIVCRLMLGSLATVVASMPQPSRITIARARGGSNLSGLPERARDVTLSVSRSKTLIYAECASAKGGRMPQ
jgi:hypothetical protein